MTTLIDRVVAKLGPLRNDDGTEYAAGFNDGVTAVENLLKIEHLSQQCSCKVTCGDVAERDDHPRAVCKSLPEYGS